MSSKIRENAINEYIEELSQLINERMEENEKLNNKAKFEEDYYIKECLSLVKDKMLYNPFVSTDYFEHECKWTNYNDVQLSKEEESKMDLMIDIK